MTIFCIFIAWNAGKDQHVLDPLPSYGLRRCLDRLDDRDHWPSPTRHWKHIFDDGLLQSWYYFRQVPSLSVLELQALKHRRLVTCKCFAWPQRWLPLSAVIDPTVDRTGWALLCTWCFQFRQVYPVNLLNIIWQHLPLPALRPISGKPRQEDSLRDWWQKWKRSPWLVKLRCF